MLKLLHSTITQQVPKLNDYFYIQIVLKLENII